MKKKSQSEHDEEDKEGNNDEHSVSYETETEDGSEQVKKREAKAPSSPMTKSIDPKSVVLNVVFDNGEDYNYAFRIVILRIREIWMSYTH